MVVHNTTQVIMVKLLRFGLGNGSTLVQIMADLSGRFLSVSALHKPHRAVGASSCTNQVRCPMKNLEKFDY